MNSPGRFFFISGILILLGAVGFLMFRNNPVKDDAKKIYQTDQIWFMSGSAPESYDMGVTKAIHHSGNSCGYIASI